MESSYALAQYLTLTVPEVAVQYRFQNFYIGENAEWVNGSHSFLPFGFSGATIDRNGTNVEAGLVLPNSDLVLDWAAEAVENFWVARVRVVRVDPEDSSVAPSDPDRYLLYNYSGQVTAGSWDESRVTLQLSSILDAVRGNVPNRRLNRSLCGHLPATNQISI